MIHRLAKIFWVLMVFLVVIPVVGALAQVSDLGQPGAIASPTAAAAINQYRVEGRIPASFRAVPGGLEVAALHDDLPRMTLTRPGVNGFFALEVGDILTHINGRNVTSVEDVFNELRFGDGPVTLDVIDKQNGNTIHWNARPISTQVPVRHQLARADGTGRVIVIHAVATGDPNLGTNIEKNLTQLQTLFESHVAANFRKDYVILRGRQCSAIGMIEAIANLQVSAQDTLFVFYQGHGAFDPRAALLDPAAGHFFDFPREDLRRSELLKAMQSKGARLTILISDACNTRAAMDHAPRYVRRTQLVQIRGWTGLEELLLCHSGTLDLTAASRGQYSWCTRDIGGWFTTSFIAGIEASTTNSDRTWVTAWMDVKSRTESVFDMNRDKYMDENTELANQPSQVPQEFIWDITRDDPPSIPAGSRTIELRAADLIEE